MSSSSTTRLVALLFVLFVSAATHADEPVVIGRTLTMHSAVLDEDRAFQVFLPESYDWAKDRRYAVLYLLDGETHARHTAASVEYLGIQGEIPEMIVVAIHSTVRIRDFTQTDWPEAWVGGGGAANFKRFLATELIPRIEAEYRTNGVRVLDGHSASGQFALYVLAEDPALFDAYVAISPSLDWDGELPQRSLAASFESRTELPKFLYFARSDDRGEALAQDERLVETLRTKSPRGFRWYAAAFPDETHGSVALVAQIDALRRLYDGYRLHPDLAGKGIAFADEHFAAVSKRVGWALPVPETVINDLGYAALQAGKTGDAIALFERNVSENPNSANAFDSLADGYAAAEDWARAAAAEDRAVALAKEHGNPNLPYFIEQSRKLNDRLSQNLRTRGDRRAGRGSALPGLHWFHRPTLSSAGDGRERQDQ